jgi:hypothetical protein
VGKGDSLGSFESDFQIDPDLPEDFDPETEEEIFRILEQLGTRPEELIERRVEYAAWLDRRRKEDRDLTET